MRPVDKAGDRDCFSACIASLLEIPCEQVPDWGYLATSEEQVSCAQKWLRPRGYSLVEVALPRRGKRDSSSWPHTGQDVAIYVILTISWKGGSWTHAVIGRLHKKRITIVHDPEREPTDRQRYLTKRQRFSHMAFLLPYQAIDKRKRA